MEEIVDSSLFFTDGWVIHRRAVVVPAQYNAYPDADMSRVLFRFEEDWSYYDVDDDMIRSVTFQKKDGTCYLMGRNGVVHSAGRGRRPFTPDNIHGTFREERITDI